jgi:hypothetical protein
LSGSLSPAFGAWRQLQILAADSTYISGTLDRSFANWPLRELSVAGTLLSGEIPRELSSWTSLLVIIASRTQVIAPARARRSISPRQHLTRWRRMRS